MFIMTIDERYNNVMAIFDQIAEANNMDNSRINRVKNVIYREGRTVMNWDNPYVAFTQETEWRLFNKAMFMEFMDRKLYEEKAFLRARGAGKRTVEILRIVGEAMHEQGV